MDDNFEGGTCVGRASCWYLEGEAWVSIDKCYDIGYQIDCVLAPLPFIFGASGVYIRSLVLGSAIGLVPLIVAEVIFEARLF